MSHRRARDDRRVDVAVSQSRGNCDRGMLSVWLDMAEAASFKPQATGNALRLWRDASLKPQASS